MPRVAVGPAELLVITHWVEVPLVETAPATIRVFLRRMVSRTLAAAAAGQITARLVAVDQESSLFVIRFQPHRLFRLHL
jgi:hypothetical protein